MSLLRQAAKQISNQDVYKGLNAFITPFNGGNLPQTLPQRQEEHLKDAEEKPELSPIDGRLIAVKDNICTSEYLTTCASSMLKDFRSPFTATVVKKLTAAGALIVGTTNLDEFGMGSDSAYSYYGPVKNLYTIDGESISAGGSSGGSAVAVASGQCYAALGTDTGGSVRLPAAYNGVVGFKPSYGMVSRRGVTAYANSLDTVGVLADCVSSTQDVFGVISAYDFQDPSSIDLESRKSILDQLSDHVQEEKRYGGRLRVGVPVEYNTQHMQPAVREAWISTLQGLQRKGNSIHSVSLPATKRALSAYYVLAPAEASSNLAKYDGARYGNKSTRPNATNDVLFSATRGQGLGEEVRRRILLGAYSLSAGAIDNYFIQAQKVRRLVQQDFNDIFAFPHPLMEHAQNNGLVHQKVDIIIAPTVQSLPPKISEIQRRDHVDAYSADLLTIPASLAGLPAINVPVPIPKEHRPGRSILSSVGLQILGQYGADSTVLNAAKCIEGLHRNIDENVWVAKEV